MKKFLKLVILTICILLVSVPVFANPYDTMLISDLYGYDSFYSNGISNNEIKVQLNGEYVDFTDANGEKVEPKMINNRTMVPMRKIFEVLGANVEWNGETRSIKATTADLEIGLQIDNNIATVKNKNGEVKEITLDAAPTIRENRTLVPVRFIAESLDKKVGWDSYNRVVVVIDSGIIEKTLKEKTHNLYEYLNTDFEKMSSFEMVLKLDGNIKYENDDYKSENTSVDINGDMDIKLSEKALALGMDLDLKGKGMLIESLKEENMESIKLDFIFDIENFVAYVSSPLFEGYEDKWVRVELDKEDEDVKTLMSTVESMSGVTGIKALEEAFLADSYLDMYTYSSLEAVLEVLPQVLGNDKFKVSSKNDVKTYTYKLTLEDLFKSILGAEVSEEEIKEITDMADFEISFDTKIDRNIEKESNCNLIFKLTEGAESIDMKIGVNGVLESYNEKVNIKMPTEKDIIDENELYGDTIGQAQFSGFATEMGGLQEMVITAMWNAKGDEAIEGNVRTDAQLYNFVARGGYDVLTTEDEGMSRWLTQANAESIPCTKIDGTYADYLFGAPLPIRKVETYWGVNQQVSYFVTPKGKVFCWPPYIYDDKSYVSHNVTVKDADGNDYAQTDATKEKEVTIYFEDTKEKVTVLNHTDEEPTIYTRDMENLGGVGVWYTENRETLGIDFSNYDNTKM